MASRDFIDSKGREWRVWSTTPVWSAAMAPEAADGWLTFESGDTLRRLAPIPRGWAECAVERLELMCRAAEDVVRRTGPFARLERPAEGR